VELTVNGNGITINKDGSVTIKGVISINGKSLPTDDGQERKTLSETKLPDLDASKIACGKINY
jgi:hypothetical protein